MPVNGKPAKTDIKQAALSYTDRKYSRGNLYGRFECSQQTGT